MGTQLICLNILTLICGMSCLCFESRLDLPSLRHGIISRRDILSGWICPRFVTWNFDMPRLTQPFLSFRWWNYCPRRKHCNNGQNDCCWRWGQRITHKPPNHFQLKFRPFASQIQIHWSLEVKQGEHSCAWPRLYFYFLCLKSCVGNSWLKLYQSFFDCECNARLSLYWTVAYYSLSSKGSHEKNISNNFY